MPDSGGATGSGAGATRHVRFLSQSRVASLRARLGRLVAGADAAADLDEPVDAYGDGLVQALEARTARLLGKPAGVFFPSGVMAQQVALRIWAARRGHGAIGAHALGHTELREMRALEAVAGLTTIPLTDAMRPLSAADVNRADAPLAAVVLELPLRDAGFCLPAWDDLRAVVGAIRARGAAVHIDGARLWECATHFGRDLSAIAALGDSVYVSFYKALDGLSGAVLAGDDTLAAEARRWRQQYGGLLYQQFPVVLAALVGLDHELPKLPAYVAKAREVAAVLERVLTHKLGACRISPRPPHTHQFRLALPVLPAPLDAAGAWQAAVHGVGLFGSWRVAEAPDWAFTEVTVAGAAQDWTAAEIERAVVAFCDRVRNPG